MSTGLPWEGWPKCPCGCEHENLKLTRYGHVLGCRCASCRGRRNQRKGQRGQARGHKALGGQGFTPSNEESVGGYDIRVQVEWKTGQQVPAGFHKFVALEWFHRALGQADRARRIGDGSMPALGIDGKWLIVQLNRDMDGAA